MSYTKVAVAGATGNLGPAVVKAIVDAGFETTILSQSGNTSGLPSTVKTVKVDYSSKDSIVSALKGQDAFVSLVPNHGEQAPLIDAAIAAGVKRFLPSEFGSDVSGDANIAALPVFGGKKKTQEYLKEKKDEISYTLVVNGLFLDWGLQVGFWANIKGGPTRLFDGGNDKHSTTTLADVGQAVVGILKHPEETKNRAVYVQSAAVSQNQLLEIALKQKPDLKVEKQEIKAADLEAKSHELLKEGGDKIKDAMLGFIAVSIFHPAYNNNWSQKNDNALLGIKEKTPEELEQLVASLL